MQQPTIASLAKETRFEGFLLVRMSEQRTGSNGGKYLDLTLGDRTGELNGKLWDGNVAPPALGSVIKVRGATLEYNGRLQLRIEKLREQEAADEVDMTLLTPCAPDSPEDMFAELDATLAAMQSDPLRRLVREMLNRYHDKLTYYPAAQRIHHAERSGLLHHTTGMLKLAKAVLPVYPSLNADLVLAGVIVHDLCKVERKWTATNWRCEGLHRNRTAAGAYCAWRRPHCRSGASRRVAGEPVVLLQHMMLSHHGEEAYGSPRKPMFPEAEVLHWIDLLDARMNEMQTALDKLPQGVFSEKIWSLERRLYHPQYGELTPEG